jgi:hypothetical protein
MGIKRGEAPLRKNNSPLSLLKERGARGERLSELPSLGKILLILGAIIIVLGLLFLFSQHIPFLGKLPGDIIIKKDGGSFYLPIVTCIIISIVLTIIINVILRLIGK